MGVLSRRKASLITRRPRVNILGAERQVWAYGGRNGDPAGGSMTRIEIELSEEVECRADKRSVIRRLSARHEAGG